MPEDWFDQTGEGGSADLPALLDALVVDAFVACLAAGALVSFGASRDGGALGVTVTYDGRWKREWFRDAEGLAVWLTGAAEFLSTAERTSASAAQERGNGAPHRRRRS